VDIRNIKLVIGTEQIRAQSKEMFLKEFSMSMVAYNLTTQLRREAAKVCEDLCGEESQSYDLC
jgi:hypothetical protein